MGRPPQVGRGAALRRPVLAPSGVPKYPQKLWITLWNKIERMP